MSRVIKFRAWDKKINLMDDDFFIYSGGVMFDRAAESYDTPNTEIEQAYDLVVMQFTGLTDVNGVEVYEGDIIECEDHYYYEISWSEKHHCWYASDCGGLDDLPSKIKVIGNIYANPELLK